jgi:hypothetical protein
MSEYIGIKELATALGISVKTLRVRVSKGKIAQPVKREGDELFWDRKAMTMGRKPISSDFHDGLVQAVRQSPHHPADFEIGIQREGGFHRGEVHVVQAKSRKGKSQRVIDEDVKHAYLTTIQPLPRKQVLSLTQKAEAAIRARGEQPTDASMLVVYRQGTKATMISLGELKRREAEDVDDFAGDVSVHLNGDGSEQPEHLHAIIYSTKHCDAAIGNKK